MQKLLALAGVDYVQWRVLTWSAVTMDVRRVLGSGQRVFGSAGFDLAVSAVGLTGAGFVSALVIWFTTDEFFGVIVLVSQTAFAVALTILLGHGARIVAPDDYWVLGFRPVSSRTYLAVRTATLAIHAIRVSTLTAVPSLVAVVLKPGATPAVVGAALLAVYGAALTTTLMLVVVYAWGRRATGPTRLAHILSYVHTAETVLVIGGVTLLTQDAGRRLAEGISVSKNVRTLLYPGAWFASYVELARANVAWFDVIAAALSVVVVVGLASVMSGRLSLDYAGRVGAMMTRSSQRRSRGETWPVFGRYEGRAVALLAAGHLREDMHFRLALLAVVSVVCLLLGLAFVGWVFPNPFTQMDGEGGSVGVLLLLLFSVSMMREMFLTSEAHRASWIFCTTQADRRALASSVVSMVVVFFVLPVVLCLVLVFAVAFGEVWAGILHALVIGGIVCAALQLAAVLDPAVPFSRPACTRFSASELVRSAGIMLAAMIVYTAITQFLYKTPFEASVAVALLCLVNVALRRTSRYAR